MKTVYFIRHAKSSWKNLSLRDYDRPLNKRGKRDAPFMAAKLKEFGIRPDAIISSPANRAFTTATFFGKAVGIPKSEIIKEKAIYEAYPSTVMKIIQAQPNHYHTIFVFGHNPTFTMLANGFNGKYIDNVPTCGIVKVVTEIDKWKDFKEKNGSVEAFYFPKQYFD